MNIYDRVINDENIQVKLILPRDYKNNNPSDSTDREDSVIRGYLENPFKVDASAEWSDALFGRDWSTKVNELLGLVGSDIKAYTLLDTTQNYLYAKIPSFNFSFYVISTKVCPNPMAKVNRLYEAIYPKRTSDATIQYHWGYTPNALGEGKNIKSLMGSRSTGGTVIITIGKWFRAINMIITNVSVEYSDSLNPDGKPYWVKPTITLTPRRLPYVDEFIQMFNPTIGGD